MTKTLSSSEKGQKSSLLYQFKNSESGVSVIFGTIIVIIVGILLFNYARSNRQAMLLDQAATIDNSVVGREQTQTYVVQPGDNLWKISEKFYGNGYIFMKIALANKLTQTNKIFTGDTLIIPTLLETQPSPDVVKITSTVSNGGELITGTTYIVQKGDSLWKISVRAYADGYKWVNLHKANKELINNPDLIFPGQVISLPR